MLKVKVFRWMREHTPRGMEWECLRIFPCGKVPMKIIGNAITRSGAGTGTGPRPAAFDPQILILIIV